MANIVSKVHGYKTYLTAGVMALMGLMFLGAAQHANWDNPQGELQSAVKNIVGWIMVTQAAGVASLRHAIGRIK